ncbi:MAG: response regulator transcription factor [Treponema sp.]|jgi:DNA-binding NarL/FixJ family response regulator|nr:response regulator transcription factor [Treponema sp.]
MSKGQESFIKILLADDQQLFSENLKLMLETLAEDIRISGIAANGREAVDMAESQQPDIILMDVSMPEMDGVEATKILHQKHPGIKIVILTTFPDDTYVQEALQYGAYGYILKNIRSEDLIASIRAISCGAVLLSPAILEKLLCWNTAKQDSVQENNAYQEIVKRLGNREKEILKLIAKGFSNKKIADTLFISEPTVRNYISSIYAKVGTKDRLEVMSIAQKGTSEYK